MRELSIRPAMIGVMVAALAVTMCSRQVRRVQIAPDAPASIAQLWQDPGGPRDLLHGPGGKELVPEGTVSFVAAETTGYSPGFDVKDAKGMEWSVKTGPEAQSEVVTSRILWAIGFHQPPTYYVENWTMTGAPAGTVELPGRFRPDLPGQQVVGDWPWHENPFVGTPEYGGLIVANLLLTNWDWKTSNNKIYQLDKPVNGVTRWFMVRDLGASLGKFTYPTILRIFRLRGFGQGTRNDLSGFEQQGFIERVDDGSVQFAYRGIYRDVISSVRAADVRWACERMSALTDQQWTDAFRSGGFTDEQTRRYTTKIKEKIAQGLQLTGAAN